MPWRKTLGSSLSSGLAETLWRLDEKEAEWLTEIRIFIGRKPMWVFTYGSYCEGKVVAQDDMDELLGALCGHARYAYESQMAQGYIPLPGGHRAGICGRAAYTEGQIERMSKITSVCIRVARAVDGASACVRRYLLSNNQPTKTLLIGPPGCGKTTVLRDAVHFLSKECGIHVAVADEREELFCPTADILRGVQKAEAMRMLIRSMAPQVIVTDEIGRVEDSQALLDAASCGIGLLSSAHAGSMTDVIRRPALRKLFDERVFDYYLLLGQMGTLRAAFNAGGTEIPEGWHGEQGSSADGNDCDQHNGFFACRW